MPADLRGAYLAMRRAGDPAPPPECLDYLLQLVSRLARAPGGPRHLAAAELCQAFQRQVTADFGALAGEVLARWNLRACSDLGRAVFLLARHGCLSLRDGETLKEYEDAGVIRTG